MNQYLKKMEQFARENKIPVILPATQKFLCSLVADKKPNTILEIGMAIGFSASCMMLSHKDARVVDIEVSLPNIELAKQNFKALGLLDRVEIVEGDCMQELPRLVQEGKKFDLIFLDGPKGKYVEMIDMLLPLLAPNGVWVTDNVLFRGMVRGGAPITFPRYQHTVDTLRQFLQILESDPSLHTQVLDVGDGLAVVTKKEEK